MFIPTPQRKIKARIGLFIFATSLFLATFALCVIFFAFFIMSHFRLISPLTKNMQRISDDGSVDIVKNLCQADHIPCISVSNLSDGSVQIILDSGAVVILSVKKDFKNQLASLQQALSQLTIKGKQFKKLDFRFANSVIEF